MAVIVVCLNYTWPTYCLFLEQIRKNLTYPRVNWGETKVESDKGTHEQIIWLMAVIVVCSNYTWPTYSQSKWEKT